MKRWWLVMVFLALLWRLLIIAQPGFEADMAYWKFWAISAADKGIVWLANETNYNYPAGFAYLLWLMGKINRLLGNLNDYGYFWNSGNYLFLLTAKLPTIMADLGVAYVLYLFFKPRLRLAYLISLVYLFHPVFWFDGAWWGQVDSLLLLPLIFGIYFLKKDQPWLSTVSLMIGFLLKFQMMVVGPIYGIYLLRRYSWRVLTLNLILATGIFALGNLHFILTHNRTTIVSLLTRNADWFPVLSLRAFNLWWLYARGLGLETSDKIVVLAGLKAKTIGLVLFSFFYGLACLQVLLKPILKNLLTALILVFFSFFLFPTQSHDRYILPALFLCLPTINYLTNRCWWLFTGAVSLTTLLNMNLSMLAEYPQNSLPVISWLNFPVLSLWISLINLILFSILAAYASKKLIDYHRG